MSKVYRAVPKSLEYDLITHAIKNGELPQEYRVCELVDAALAFAREQRQLAERTPQVQRGGYVPVRYSTFVEDQSYNDTYLLVTLDGSQLEIGRDPTLDGVTVNLPSDMRLCRWQEGE